MAGENRDDIRPGMTVGIVLKNDQRSCTLTWGVVRDVLSRAREHSRGIKVRLSDGRVGRVRVTRVLTEDDASRTGTSCGDGNRFIETAEE